MVTSFVSFSIQIFCYIIIVQTSYCNASIIHLFPESIFYTVIHIISIIVHNPASPFSCRNHQGVGSLIYDRFSLKYLFCQRKNHPRDPILPVLPYSHQYHYNSNITWIEQCHNMKLEIVCLRLPYGKWRIRTSSNIHERVFQ